MNAGAKLLVQATIYFSPNYSDGLKQLGDLAENTQNRLPFGRVLQDRGISGRGSGLAGGPAGRPVLAGTGAAQPTRHREVVP